MITRWTAAELEVLEEVAMNHPPDLIAKRYNYWAIRHGFNVRTHKAILTRLSRSNITVRAAGDWVNSGLICKLLGVSHNTTQHWTTNGWINAHRDSRGRRYFQRIDLRRMARERPAAFAGINAAQLYLLLEDRALADDIAATHTRRAMQPKAVRIIETGWQYPSIRAAAARVHVSRQAIQHAIRTGGTAATYHWTHA